jgi:hypothetical protein
LNTMARLFSILALVAVCLTVVYAQQEVPCTFSSASFSGRNRYVSTNGAVSSAIPGTFSSRDTTGNNCWQLDGFASTGAALIQGELPTPASPLIQLPRTSATTATAANSVCTTDNAIYGKVREISVEGITNECSITGQVFARTSAPDNGQGRFSIGSDNGCGYTARYRLDGSASACPSSTFTQSFSLQTASGRSLNAMGDHFEITMGTDGGSVNNVDVTIDVFGSSAAERASITFTIEKNSNSLDTARNYLIPFSAFTGTAGVFNAPGAIEVRFGGPDIDALMFFFDVVKAPVTSVSATVFVDCGCNGFQQGTGDSLQSNQQVTLTIGGTGCTAATQVQSTNANGAVSFTNLPSGCTYTLSTAGLNLCTNTPSSQTVGAGGSAQFAIQGAQGGLTIPADRTVNCGADTSPAATGTASSGAGQCGAGSGTPTFTDAVAAQTCSAPGGTLSVIRRTWSLSGVASQTQTITVVDTRAIALSGVPTGSTLACNAAVPTAQVTGTACTAVTVTNTQSNAAGVCDTTTCTQTGSVTVTYTGRDVCGNTASRSVTYQRTGCAAACPPPVVAPPPPNTPTPPPPTQLPTNANCRFICDDDDSSAVSVVASLAVIVLAVVAAL